MPLGPVEYLESRGHHLYPVQRFILKLMYGEPLDQDSRTIPIRVPTENEPLAHLSEAGYLRFLQLQRRTNVDGGAARAGYRRVLLCTGRRAGKSHLTSLIHTYEAHLFEGAARTATQL